MWILSSQENIMCLCNVLDSSVVSNVFGHLPTNHCPCCVRIHIPLSTAPPPQLFHHQVILIPFPVIPSSYLPTVLLHVWYLLPRTLPWGPCPQTCPWQSAMSCCISWKQLRFNSACRGWRISRASVLSRETVLCWDIFFWMWSLGLESNLRNQTLP